MAKYNRNNETEAEVSDTFGIRLELRVKNSALVQAREKLGLTAKQVAEMAGVGYSTYLAYESMRSFPKTPTKEKIEIFYTSRGVNLDMEKVFPAELKGVKTGKHTLDTQIPMESLISFQEAARQKLLPYSPSPEEEFMGEELKSGISKALNTLTPRESYLITSLFGLDDKGTKTLDELGKEFGVSPAMIGVRRNKILARLRRVSRSKYFADVLQSF